MAHMHEYCELSNCDSDESDDLPIYDKLQNAFEELHKESKKASTRIVVSQRNFILSMESKFSNIERALQASHEVPKVSFVETRECNS